MKENKHHLFTLGLDLSTQSLSALVLDVNSKRPVLEISLDYLNDKRLNNFGLRESDYILPPRTDGEADQPSLLFFAALDALFSDLKDTFELKNIAIINVSLLIKALSRKLLV